MGAARWAGPSAGVEPRLGEVLQGAGPVAVGNEGAGLVVGWEAGPEVKRAELLRKLAILGSMASAEREVGEARGGRRRERAGKAGPRGWVVVGGGARPLRRALGEAVLGAVFATEMMELLPRLLR